MIFYVDNIMVIHHAASRILTCIDKYFTCKPYYIGEPDIYLSAKLRNMMLPNDVWCCITSPSKYAQKAVKKLQDKS